ncbi:gas vesicle protein GvpL [Bacillus idriensis]|uniref:Gas vesicle protein GvpL n=1 Tax=Metabacillus idriensis TaxID=324768 RepID=A0A6I2MHN0_9BACI|nr:GvpL/GvpF family gas vesicle protein [Metabacillus idriensis]MRX56642.1 gas vesicle protein GvpL [Metabacillus idriensis]
MGDLIYLYGLIPTEEEALQQLFPSLTGFDGKRKLYTILIDNVTAVVCELDSDDYSEEAIKDKIDSDMEWLQEKALHHHETVAALYKCFTIIPLKFCTIYKNEESLQQTIQSNVSQIEETLSMLQGNEEWNVKIYSDDKELKKQISENNSAIEAKKKEISELPRGRQFFEKKKIDKLTQDELENEKNRVCEQVHEKLKEHSLHAAIKKNWSKDVTGLKENMAWNSVFLLPISSVENFLKEIKRFEQELGGTGWRFEATGPWPAYHFSSFSSK